MWNRVGPALVVLGLVSGMVWVSAETGEAQRRGRRARNQGPVAFFAGASEEQTIRGDTKLDFRAVSEGSTGWDPRAGHFTAPADGAYHFDLGARITHAPPSLSCAYTFTLVKKRGGNTVASVEMLVLEQSTVDVGDTGRGNPVMRQTSWRLRDSAGVTLPLKEGDILEVHAEPSIQLCGGQARLTPLSGSQVVSFFSGHRVR